MKQSQTQYKKENPRPPEHNGNAKSELSHEAEGEGNYRITHKLVTESHGRAEVRERAEVKSRGSVAVTSSPSSSHVFQVAFWVVCVMCSFQCSISLYGGVKPVI